MRKAWHTIKRVMSSPWFGLLGWFVAGVSTFLAFYFYSETKEGPCLSYYVEPVRAIVLRAERASSLSVEYKDRRITTDLTAAQVVLWNAGKSTIKKNNLLKPILIYTAENTPILEASVKKTTREVTQFALNTDELQKGILTLTWDVLEQDDGARIQIVYEGDPDVRISLDGAIEGQEHIKELKTPEGIIYRREFPRAARHAYERLEVLFLLMMPVTLIPLAIYAYDSTNGLLSRLGALLVILMVTGCMALIFYDLLYGYVEPPFGF